MLQPTVSRGSPAGPVATVLVAALLLAGCARGGAVPGAPASFHVATTANAPIRIVAYGDTRFTAATERSASAPDARRAIIASIAAEAPAAVFISGDIPWHGGTVADYAAYREETAAWRGFDVYPALGNHEFQLCMPDQCLENWWNVFPALRGMRWYAVAVGARLRALVLDSQSSLDRGAPQRAWLEAEFSELPRSVDFVLILLHHPPVADLQWGEQADHNPRPDEIALAGYLKEVAARLRARLIVCAGHIHNYERREQDGIVYLVSGGGGAAAVDVRRDGGDLYRGPGFPNFHYLRFTVTGELLRGEMLRLEDYDSPAPGRFERRDVFEVRAAPR